MSTQHPPAEPTPAAAVLEQSLIDLQIKVSYMDDLLEELNAIVANQQQQIDRLMMAVVELRQQRAPEALQGNASALQRAMDELPPHY